MNWIELENGVSLNLDHVRVFQPAVGGGTEFHLDDGTYHDSKIPYDVVKTIIHGRKNSTDETLKKILAGQTTQVP